MRGPTEIAGQKSLRRTLLQPLRYDRARWGLCVGMGRRVIAVRQTYRVSEVDTTARIANLTKTQYRLLMRDQRVQRPLHPRVQLMSVGNVCRSFVHVRNRIQHRVAPTKIPKISWVY